MVFHGINIILGCFGRTDDGFVSCASTENIILTINQESYNYNKIMDYLDKLQLFDKMMLDYNSIRHFIFNMREKFDYPTKKLWSEKQFNLFQKFTLTHKDCGLFIKLNFAQ